MNNPAARVECYTEKASEIRFLTLKQIDEQLHALANYPQLQSIVAVYIFAGLRRIELCWLTIDDIDFFIAFDTTPESWLMQQMQYDLWQAEQRRNEI